MAGTGKVRTEGRVPNGRSGTMRTRRLKRKRRRVAALQKVPGPRLHPGERSRLGDAPTLKNGEKYSRV